jgi:hypothetical protein
MVSAAANWKGGVVWVAAAELQLGNLSACCGLHSLHRSS